MIKIHPGFWWTGLPKNSNIMCQYQLSSNSYIWIFLLFFSFSLTNLYGQDTSQQDRTKSTSDETNDTRPDNSYASDDGCSDFFMGVTDNKIMVNIAASAMGFGRQRVSMDNDGFLQAVKVVAYDACSCGWRMEPDLTCRIRISGVSKNVDYFSLENPSEGEREGEGEFGFAEADNTEQNMTLQLTREINAPDVAYLEDNTPYRINCPVGEDGDNPIREISADENNELTLQPQEQDKTNPMNISWTFRNVNHVDQSSGVYICVSGTDMLLVRGYYDEVQLKSFRDCSPFELERARWNYHFSGRDQEGNQLYQFSSNSEDEPRRWMTQSPNTDKVLVTNRPNMNRVNWRVDINR